MARGKSARNFSIDLTKFGIKSREQATKIFKKITFDLDKAVVQDTPVDTGRAKGNWFPSIGIPSNHLNTDARRFSKKGVSVEDRIRDKLSEVNLGDTFWLTNNVSYILKLERGSSKKSPDGMVRKNLQRVQARFGGDISR